MSSSKNPVRLYLTCMTPALWGQFYSWYDMRQTDRGHYPTCVPNHGVWVVREWPSQGPEPKVNGVPLPEGTPQLIAGCAIFPTDGPYACVEWVNTNPQVPARLRAHAMEKVCWGVRNYGAMTGKKPVCYPMHKGIIRMMERTGYDHVKESVKTMYSPPFVPIGVYEEKQHWGGNGVPETASASADPKGEMIGHFGRMTVDPEAEVMEWRQSWAGEWDAEDMDDG